MIFVFFGTIVEYLKALWCSRSSMQFGVFADLRNEGLLRNKLRLRCKNHATRSTNSCLGIYYTKANRLAE